ncbi:FkbM family methyltransferase [Trichothermofontia sichuanensis B231]|uniref:FkbM family methyltransferase n=1 Tax=Trichothermofontia sichuanensis TaxID=3045816 RepID=UPI0022469F76|nr:FkbM family methyltransferase [Trichothermofontia sichuanensis]UZQ55086.1 FkbM family methyltransferase [Trichothermofontia sichuanensis B231]
MEIEHFNIEHFNSYVEYLYPDKNFACPEIIDIVKEIVEKTLWDNPQSSLDWNNLAVMALIEAERNDDLTLRSTYLEMALEALQEAIAVADHPLIFAHHTVWETLTESKQVGIKKAFSYLINMLDDSFNPECLADPGLIYIPCKNKNASPRLISSQIIQIFNADNAYIQALRLLCETCCQNQIFFYSSVGLRFLNLAIQLLPDSAITNLKLGIANIGALGQEGLFNLHRANRLLPEVPQTWQALYLVYREMGWHEVAQSYLNRAKKLASNSPDLAWRWTELSIDEQVTYVPFDQTLCMAVEPSFKSIVTMVLLAEGDWCEEEMEFWRYWLKPGMTVIDVGANAGVYTFSAANRVGPTGRVFAIEPFSKCVHYLETTKNLNQLEWVTIYQRAASNHRGKVRLSLSRASEFNKVIIDEAMTTSSFEEVDAFLLDDLIHQEHLSQVDWLKIDAEGHELQVLEGSQRLLEQFMPGILYEHTVEGQAVNISVAQYLQNKDYQLFLYKAYLRQLMPIQSLDNLKNSLNVIALPTCKLEELMHC